MSNGNERYYVVCSVCKRPSPEGRILCQYCWSRLQSGVKINQSEADELLRKWKIASKRKKKIKWISITTGSVILVAALVLSYLDNYTDTLQIPSPTLNSNPPDGQWSMFRHDLLHSGATGNNTMLPQGQVQWTFSASGPIYSSPAVVDGVVYFGSRDGKMYALNAASGSELWEYQTGSWVDSSPTVTGGIVYFGSHDGNLYALDARTGRKIWSFHTVYVIDSSPAVAGGVVYFGSADWHLYALDALTGKKLWAFKASVNGVDSSPVVANGIVYFEAGDSWIYGLRADNGQFRLHFKAYNVASSPAIDGKIVYFCDSFGTLSAVDGLARSRWYDYGNFKGVWVQLWGMGVAPKPPPISGSLWSTPLGYNPIISSPVVSDNKLYVGADNDLVAVDTENEKPLWSFQTGGRVNSSPAVVENTVYVGSEDGRIYAIDATSGQELWHVVTGAQIDSSPALANGILYVGSFDGKMYAIK